VNKTKDDYPIVLTVNEVMEILRIGKRVAHELMNRTDFPTKKLASLNRVNRDSFFDWIQKQ
jgi:predicted DNA-binding transcriptional regulator AlpA